MQDFISISGVIGTEPRHITTAAGLDVTSFRLGSSRSRFDAARGEWVDEETNWYSVVAFKTLAEAAAQALHKRDRVLVQGRLKVQESKDDAGRTRVTAEIVAEAIGRDVRPGKAGAAGDGGESADGAAAERGDRELQAVGWAAPGAEGPDIPF